MAKTNFFEIIRDPYDRVLQISADCYLIYLGSNFLEKRAYLRVGNCQTLDARFSDEIGYVILTDEPVGSLLNEHKNLASTGSITYIGSERQLDACFTVLKSAGCDTSRLTKKTVDCKQQPCKWVLEFEEVKSAINTEFHQTLHADGSKQDKPVEIRQEITIEYNEYGGFIIKIGGKPIFDLKDRLTKDSTEQTHTADLISRFVTRNKPLYSGKGFIMPGDAAIFYDRKVMCLAGLPEDYTASLIRADVDPDRLKMVYDDGLKPAEFENLIKRNSKSENPSDILTSNHDGVRRITDYWNKASDTVKPVSNQPYLFSSSSIFFHPEASVTRLSDAETGQMVEYLAAAKIDPKAPVSWDFSKAHIVIVPELVSSKITLEEDQIGLAYSAKETAQNSLSSLPSGWFKLFPYIDYRYDKVFTHEGRVNYALEVYLNLPRHEYFDILREPYRTTVKAVYDLADFYIQKNIEFRSTLGRLLNQSRRLLPPTNRIEYFLLNNCMEILRYMKDLLMQRSILRLDIIDSVLTEMKALRDRSSNIEISDFNFKGNICRMPNGKRYLFYSTDERIEDREIPRQHAIALVKGLQDDPFLVEQDRLRSIKILIQHVKEFKLPNRKLTFKENSEFEYSKIQLIFKQHLSERERYDDIASFISYFRNLGYEDQKRFYFLVKSSLNRLNDFEKDEQLFGDLLSGFTFTVSRKKFKSQAGKKHRRKSAIKFAWMIPVMLFFIAFVFLNAPRTLSLGRSLRLDLLETPVVGSFYIVDDFKRWTSWRSVLYAEKAAKNLPLTVQVTEELNGKIVTNWVINPEVLKLPVRLTYEDFNKAYADLTERNGFSGTNRRPERIYPGEQLTLSVGRKYQVNVDDSLWSIAFRDLKLRQRNELETLATRHLLMCLYEQCLKEGRDRMWKEQKLANLVEIKRQLVDTRTEAKDQYTQVYADKLSKKADQVIKQLQVK